MQAAQSIDFTRGDIGFWLLWVLIPLMAVLNVRRKRLVGDRWKILKVLAIRLLGGLFLATLLVALLSVWARRGPQYFVKLRLQEDAVNLEFRGVPAHVEIPFSDIKTVAIVKSRRCKRLQIETSSQKFQSYGFGKLDDDQAAVLDALRSRVPAKMAPQLP